LPPRLVVRCWGARGSVPSPGPHTLRYGGHTSCLELSPANGARVVFDAGSGIRAFVNDLTGRSDSTTAPQDLHLFLTHRHLDHVMGLPLFLPIVAEKSRVVIRCGNASVSEVEQLLETLVAPPLFVFLPEFREPVHIVACEPDSVTSIGVDLQVHRFDARHNGGAAVFRVDDASGPLMAFAPDNELSYANTDTDVVQWRVALARELRDVPVLIHDAMYNENELHRFAGWGHSSPLEATRFAIECGAKKLLLFHHHPDRTDNEVDALVQECRAFAKSNGSELEIEAAYEGMTIAIG
jgi:phosphoribosyl 1,2-cyclic phosphodiesterase